MTNFKQWRKEKCLTQERAADMIGVSKSTWGRIERGQETKEAFLLLAEALVNNADPVVIQPTVIAEPEQPEDVSDCQFSISNLRSDIDGDSVWFALSDVCNMVGYTNVTAASNLVKSDDLTKREVIDSAGRRQGSLFISESGLYQFLFRCRLPKAEPFSLWVTREVLPSIRKTGSYSAQPHTEADPLDAMIMALNEARENKRKIAVLEQRVSDLQFLEHSKTDRADVIEIVESELRSQAEQQRAFVMMRKELELKEQGAAWSVVNKYGGDFGETIKSLRTVIRKAVTGARGTKSWGRQLFQKCDFAIAYQTIETWLQMREARPPEQREIDFGGDVA